MAYVLNGWYYAPDAYLTKEHRENNAKLVHKFFRAAGWSYHAICAMLGNMEVESSINPGLIEGRKTTLDPDKDGYGLTQWTPASKLINWANANGLIWLNNGDTQCKRIQYEMLGEYQWIQNVPISFAEFAHSNASIEYLTRAFCRNYERPADPDFDLRIANALYWYNYLKSKPPIWLLWKMAKEGRA